jgi:hypothetical protein
MQSLVIEVALRGSFSAPAAALPVCSAFIFFCLDQQNGQ